MNDKGRAGRAPAVRAKTTPGKPAAANAVAPPAARVALRGADFALLGAFVLSGAASLGLELVWMRLLGLAFGSETFGMLGVLAGFFAGLALGSAAFHRPIVRSARPALFYIGAELTIAAYALAGPWFMLPLADALPRWLGPAIGDNRSLLALTLNLGLATVVLLPATAAMGTTTVALVEAWRRRRPREGSTDAVAWVYFANTLGATLGVAVCIYVLLPGLGIAKASAALAAFSLAASVIAWRWQRAPETAKESSPRATEGARQVAPVQRRGALYAVLFVTGLAGIGLETVGTHVLAQIFQNTVHTFADILAIYLLGTAAGAWLYARIAAPRFASDRDRGTSVLVFALGAAGVLSGIVLSHAAALMSMLAPAGSDYARQLAAEALTAALVFVPPTVMMGAVFSHLVGQFSEEGIGYASAFNTLGASFAPFLFGLVLIPTAGYGVAWYGAAAMYLLPVLAAIVMRGRGPRWLAAGAGAAVVLAVFTYTPLVLVEFPPSARLVDQRISLMGVVSVSEDLASQPPGGAAPRVLQVDQKFLMGGSPGFVTKRMGHLPMLVAHDPRDALYLGVGTGITAGSALDYDVRRVTAVELLPQVVDMLPWFKDANRDLAHDPRVSLYASDARRFVQATGESYDVIVADLYHPSRDGTGALYTEEHFSNVRSRLREGGLFVQWLPLYQLRPTDLKTIVRTFLAVFPQAHSVIGNYSGSARFGLIGWAPPPERVEGVDIARAKVLLAEGRPGSAIFDGVKDLLASYMLDAAALRRYAGDGPINTDVNQRITFDAAGGMDLGGDANAYRSLASLLPYRMPYPDGFVQGSDPELRRDVQPYADAVSHFLAAEALRLEARSPVMPAKVVDEYVKAYESDVRFTLAVGKLLESARDPAAAKALVLRLWRAHPQQENIDRLRQRLESTDDPTAIRGLLERFIATGGN